MSYIFIYIVNAFGTLNGSIYFHVTLFMR